MLSEEFHLVLIALPCGFVLLVHQEDVRLRVVLVAVRPADVLNAAGGQKAVKLDGLVVDEVLIGR